MPTPKIDFLFTYFLNINQIKLTNHLIQRFQKLMKNYTRKF